MKNVTKEINSPQVQMCAWKWWVWKSTISCSKAVFNALEWKKTLIIDMDWGKAMARVIWQENFKPNKISSCNIDNLWIAAIQSNESLKTRKEVDNFKEYISQFPRDYWHIAFNDMLSEFFGVCVNIDELYKMLSLVIVLNEAQEKWFEDIIIDIEPTSWFNRFVTSTESLVRSLHNLSKIGIVKLSMLWTTWPDITAYLKWEYIKKVPEYTRRLENWAQMINNAQFTIVSIPEPEPLSQATWEVKDLIDKVKWKLQWLVLNNCWRLWEKSIEKVCIKTAQEMANIWWVPLKQIKHSNEMFIPWNRIEVLRSMWESLSK
ncbi:MAG: hypothetical protein ACD_78C00427G0002 [uncultured bacterium (gcode 4)]|uniref:ArsA/GET3 Anion-transporting ATPase-like domain-containing protein n=1 Tax=uncultured bacterium (gcode 4) TaxID=1234023 RepID=K1XGI4_9BACT|nr:MAG: hypothetical protein ACD_78C00427G0002 [uncultured bacterium (gcode 4)]